MANTKLDAWEKEELKKNLMHDAKLLGIRVINLDDATTMAFRVCGNVVEFSLSVKSPDEQKFRRKVGQYHALVRILNNESVKMATGDFEAMCEHVWYASLL